MIRADAAWIAAACGGTWTLGHDGSPAASAAPAITIQGVATDSRADVAGRLFVAIAGPRHDGHAHLAAAHAGGAVAALVEREPADAPADLPVLVVPDTRQALTALARAWRAELTATVVGITGSVGKTSTKELLRAVLAEDGHTHAAPSSFNNALGVPLTILGASRDDRWLVAEVGTGGPGELAPLCALVRPDAAIITTVGHAHLEAFRDRAALAAEKATLAESNDPHGPLVVDADCPVLLEASAVRTHAGRITVGRTGTADARLAACGRDGATGPSWFELEDARGRSRWTVGLSGDHQARNAAMVVVLARALGVDDAAIARGLAAVTLPPGRSRHVTVGPVEVVDDSWNASPESMAASLAAFVAETEPAVADGARRVLVLGDMLELGAAADACHRAVGGQVAAIGAVDPALRLIAVGAHARTVVERAQLAESVAVARDDAAGLRAALDAIVQPGDHVLLKGSRGLRLERCLEWIESVHAPPQDAAASARKAVPDAL